MNIEVLADSGSVAQRAAFVIAEEAWAAIATRGLFVMAVSGGHTPWIMLRALAAAKQGPAAGTRRRISAATPMELFRREPAVALQNHPMS